MKPSSDPGLTRSLGTWHVFVAGAAPVVAAGALELRTVTGPELPLWMAISAPIIPTAALVITFLPRLHARIRRSTFAQLAELLPSQD